MKVKRLEKGKGCCSTVREGEDFTVCFFGFIHRERWMLVTSSIFDNIIKSWSEETSLKDHACQTHLAQRFYSLALPMCPTHEITHIQENKYPSIEPSQLKFNTTANFSTCSVSKGTTASVVSSLVRNFDQLGMV